MRDTKLKRGLLKIWFPIYDTIQLYHVRKNYGLSIMSAEETIEHIKQTNCSITRFGDGEFGIMLRHGGPSFQQATTEMSVALAKVFEHQSSSLLICLPHALVSTRGLKPFAKNFWEGWARNNQKEVVRVIHESIGNTYHFGDAYISRPYSAYQSKKHTAKIFSLIKTLWQDRDVLIVEGKKTRLGIGNDLFCGARSIKRILCPAENAFAAYDKILEATVSCWQGELIILALGPTATVLASDLSKKGIQALDLGHIDIQYEWYLSGTSFVPVKGKYTNETLDGRQPEDCEDNTYLSQIIAEIN